MRSRLLIFSKGFIIEFHYKEISNQLGTGPHTCRTHRRAIHEKLHVRSRAEATVKYFGH
ncbi:MAG TPA: LuxR C-terminal-related transcriptional regulator [Verrucomicrobiae bacterium]|nr:LuxR C-terminal-related transcriptional regulator [Verrucomicrobiae bacterium]